MANRLPEMDWSSSDLIGNFKLFKQRMELCLDDAEITDDDRTATKIQIAVGNEGLKRINASGLSEEDKKIPEKLWSLFENQLKIKVNFRIHSLEQMKFKQKQNESIDYFVNRCRIKGKECDFTEPELAERVIELVINSTPIDAFQKKLLGKDKRFTIDNLLVEGRRYEAIVDAGKRLTSMGENYNNIDK